MKLARINGPTIRARRLHSLFDSINQVEEHASSAPVQRSVRLVNSIVLPHLRHPVVNLAFVVVVVASRRLSGGLRRAAMAASTCSRNVDARPDWWHNADADSNFAWRSSQDSRGAAPGQSRRRAGTTLRRLRQREATEPALAALEASVSFAATGLVVLRGPRRPLLFTQERGDNAVVACYNEPPASRIAERQLERQQLLRTV